MMQITLNPESRIRRNPEIVHSAIDGEVVMMSLDKGEYFGLNAVGSHVWNRLQEPRSMGELCRHLQEKFEVSDEQCRQDVARFLSQIAECGLISVSE
jgi:Coenzyme PQQ synthesis protein D (PqqD)